MYIPDDFLGTKISLTFYAIMIPLWAMAIIRIKEKYKYESIPIIILGTAFSFTLLMFDLPFLLEIPGTITCGALLSILLGPWTSLIIISAALALKGIFIGGIGITSFAANSFIIAFVTSFGGYYIYSRVMHSETLRTIYPKALIASISGYFSSIFSVIAVILIFKLQLILSALSDSPDFPIILRKSMAIILAEHLLILGIIEGLMTGLVISYLMLNGYLADLIVKNKKLISN